MKTTNTRIIGIDPGTNILGYAIIEIEKPIIKVNSLGVIHLDKLGDHYTKLRKIFEKITYLLETYQPTAMAIEAPFFGKNVQAMLKLGRAQGVAITAAMMKDITVEEYAPRKIKQAVTGNGNASKQQVANMLQHMLKMDTMPTYLDATDALGAAVCYHLESTNILGKVGKKKGKGWAAFIKNNPGRVKK